MHHLPPPSAWAKEGAPEGSEGVGPGGIGLGVPSSEGMAQRSVSGPVRTLSAKGEESGEDEDGGVEREVLMEQKQHREGARRRLPRKGAEEGEDRMEMD